MSVPLLWTATALYPVIVLAPFWITVGIIALFFGAITSFVGAIGFFITQPRRMAPVYYVPMANAVPGVPSQVASGGAFAPSPPTPQR